VSTSGPKRDGVVRSDVAASRPIQQSAGMLTRSKKIEGRRIETSAAPRPFFFYLNALENPR
jgi:hypothetical protein